MTDKRVKLRRQRRDWIRRKNIFKHNMSKGQRTGVVMGVLKHFKEPRKYLEPMEEVKEDQKDVVKIQKTL